jgi:CheY-like chemotaxis protein/HPt (histidine-containing phosphotransfer) domain-containing protein
MDVQMPILDGNEATRRIRGELNESNLPIVALTAGALVGERQRALDAGMNDFISKPFDPQALIRKVRRLAEEFRRAPVPMVLLDAKKSGGAAESLFISSVDAGAVQRVFGEDLGLFKSLLRRMLHDFADFALPIAVASDGDDRRRGLQERAHKLKGSAGMLGATNVMRLAGATEIALDDSRPADIIDGILKQLAVAFVTLREESEPMLRMRHDATGTAGGAPSTLPTGSQDKSVPDAVQLDELCTLLDHHNLDSLDKFAALSRSLPDLIGAACFDGMREAVDELDFKRAATLLREARVAAR